MFKTLGVMILALGLLDSADAAEKIRFGFPDLAAQFIPLPINKKKDFFYRQIDKFNSRYILLIKAPDIFACKINIPNNKCCSSNQQRGKKRTPLLVKFNARMKTESERNNHRHAISPNCKTIKS